MLSILLFAVVSAFGSPADPLHSASLAADSVLVSVDAVKRGMVVAVFVLVPGNDQPNTNFTDAADLLQLAHRHLINYVLKGSEAVVVKEAASLGYGTTTIQLVPPAAP